jgi:hypothetical protein
MQDTKVNEAVREREKRRYTYDHCGGCDQGKALKPSLKPKSIAMCQHETDT